MDASGDSCPGGHQGRVTLGTKTGTVKRGAWSPALDRPVVALPGPKAGATLLWAPWATVTSLGTYAPRVTE